MREFSVFGGLGVSEQYKNSAAFIFIIYVFMRARYQICAPVSYR